MKVSIMPIVGASLFCALLMSCISFVDTKEVAVVYRFGALDRILESGVQFHLPYPVDSIEKLPIRKTHVIELGKQLVLTADANLVQINIVAQYDVLQVQEYVLGHKNVDGTISKIIQRNMVEVLGQSIVDQERFLDRNALEKRIRNSCDAEIQEQKLGIEIISLGLEELSAPKAVIDAFNEISSARGEKETMILSAQSYASKLLPDARGESQKIIEQATSNAFGLVSKAKERTYRYEQLLPLYRKNPLLVQQNLRSQTWKFLAQNQVLIHHVGSEDEFILSPTNDKRNSK